MRVKQESSVTDQPCESEICVVAPIEEVLADKYCDSQECLWRGETEFKSSDEQLGH